MSAFRVIITQNGRRLGLLSESLKMHSTQLISKEPQTAHKGDLVTQNIKNSHVYVICIHMPMQSRFSCNYAHVLD